MRSKLNEMEASSSQVYTDLQAKLSEKNFLATNSESTSALMNGTAGNTTTATNATLTPLQLDDEPLDTEGYNAADHMTFCAAENGNCVCDGTIYFGKVEPLRWNDC